MKLTIERTPLLRALEPAKRVSESRSTIPILTHILLAVDAGKLRIEATDMDLVLSVAVVADVERAGSLTVPAAMFFDLIRKLPDGAAIVLEEIGGLLHVRSGRTRAKLATLPAEHWPGSKDDEWKAQFSIAGETLGAMLGRTEFAICSEETRYYLCGAYFHHVEIEGRRIMRMVTTDGHRLARIDAEAPEGAAGMPGVIVPRKAGSELEKLCKGIKSDVTVSLSTNKMRVEIGDVALSTKLIDGTYPDYGRVIPAGNNIVAMIDRSVFASAVDRVATIATERGRAVKLAFEEGRLVLSVTSADSGSAVEEIDVTYDGPPIEIGFNSRYLADVLATIEGGTVRVAMADAGSPAVLQSAERDDLLVVLMPMRV